MKPSIHGRGAAHNPANRYARTEPAQLEEVDAWPQDPDPKPRTVIHLAQAKSIISRNQSPDLRFSLSINPYQGCEHGCIYCYARPSHAYWGYSAGLDFETQLISKPNAVQLLRQELSKPSHQVQPICIGSNTDCYQPIERQQQLTRGILEVLLETQHPTLILTKNALIERDLDLLQALASKSLVQVLISITTLQGELARNLEPRASQPLRRLQTIKKLSEAGIPVGVLSSPMIPAINDHELEAILKSSSQAGARMAGYALLRLPLELAQLWEDWLERHYPLKREHAMNLLRQMRGGKDYQSGFGTRMRGEGPFAQLLAQRFALACRRLKLNTRLPDLRTDLFQAPNLSGQLNLF